MTCDRRLLSSYRDAQLSADERSVVERHLQGCPDCRRELQSMVRIGQVVRSMPWETAPASIGYELRRKIAEREEVRRQPLPLGGYARAFAPVAAFAGAALTVIVVFRPGAGDQAFHLQRPGVVTSQANPVAASQPDPQVAAQAASQTTQAASQATQAAAERPGNPKVDVAAARPASGGADAARPDRMLAASAPGVPSLATALAAQDVSGAMPGSIQRLYSARQPLRDQLGSPLPGSRTVTLLEQSFQGGLAIWRGDTHEIYVLRREGNGWSTYADSSGTGERGAVDAPPPGALVPAGGFGTLWRTRPEVKSRLGWAVYEPRGSGGTIQAFEHGLVVWSPHGLLYVLTDDGKWRTYADATPV